MLRSINSEQVTQDDTVLDTQKICLFSFLNNVNEQLSAIQNIQVK